VREGGLLCFSFNVRVSVCASHSVSTASYVVASACCNIIHCKYPAVVERVDPSAESADRSDRGSNGIVRRPPDRRELMIGHRASHRQRGRQKSRCRAHIAERKGAGGGSRARCAPKSSTQITPAAINERLRSPHVESHCVLERSSRAAGPLISRYRIGAVTRGQPRKERKRGLAFRRVIKTVVSVEPPPLITANYP